MAFVDFERIPNDAPVVARPPAPIAVVAAVSRPAPRKLRIPWSLLIAVAVLAWIGLATAEAVDSPSLGFVAATLSFLIGVAARSAMQPVRARR